MKKLTFCLLALLALSSCQQSQKQNDQQHSPHDLVFENLAPSWDEGIPLGNGMMGALIWKKGDRLRISLDRADLWDLRLLGNVYKEGLNYSWVQEHWKADTYNKVQQAFDVPYDRSAGPSKIPVAALEIPLEKFGPVESVRLKVHQGLCQVRWKQGIILELYIHPTDPVGWFRISGANKDSRIEMATPPFSRPAENSDRNRVTGGQDLDRLGYPAGKLTSSPDQLEYVQEGFEGFTYQVSCNMDRSDEEITGCWSISAHYPDKEAAPKASDLLKQAMDSGYEEGRKALLQWWQNYWSRSAIQLPDTLLEKQYYLEMYKFGAAARKGAPPISLQAVWTADNGKLPPWKGDFHHDLNTQLSYWPAYAGNQLDLEEGFLDWLWSVREEGKKYTRWFYEAEGLNIPGVTTLTGVPMGGWIQYSFGPTVSAWLGQHFYLHWKYSQDRSFLKERAYPWLKEVAVFLDEVALKDASGNRSLPLSSSPEIYDNRREAWFDITTNYDLALIRFAYKAAAEMAGELNLPEEAEQWLKILGEWPQLAVDPQTGLMFAPGFPYHESHRHFSHLMGYHPLGLLDVSQGEEAKKVIYNTLRQLEKKGPDYWTGYSYSWQGNLYARAGEGDNAARALKDFATCFTLPNSFHVNGDQSGTGKSTMTYRPFTLEGNFAFASGIQEMLIQSHTGVIRLFPALPESWKDVSFLKLRTMGAFLVSADMVDGEVTRVEITAEKGGRVNLVDPFLSGETEELLSFTLGKGESVVLPKK
jgi:alpha-L-fucosidase 2